MNSNKSVDGNFQSFLIIEFDLFSSISTSFSMIPFSIDSSVTVSMPFSCLLISLSANSSFSIISSDLLIGILSFASSLITSSKKDSSSIIFLTSFSKCLSSLLK